MLALLRLSYTVQPHGMLAPSTSSFRRLFDKFVTRLVLARAKEVYFLNSAEAAALQNLGARASQLHRLGNGVACIDRPSVRHPSSGLPVRVLFAARLHPRKRVGVFLEAAADLIRGTSGDDWRFMVVGPDEGDLKLVLRSIESESSAGCLSYGGALEHSQLLKLMRQTDIFVLCSEDEPFGLAALEAMAAGSATVVTEGTGLTEYQTVEKSIATFDGSASGLAAAIVNVRREIGTYSRAALKQASSPELNINEIASSLLRRWGGL
ncbi:glycosyltransferase [Curtobacterium pusillum]|uniref:Glycosyltransferase n=1 Tax=Curtobacterium pusillum TaxID=69373 RepID=A0ABX2M944_9MICO|nr:glycosyltransferase [Curtobacterium pusillum]